MNCMNFNEFSKKLNESDLSIEELYKLGLVNAKEVIESRLGVKLVKIGDSAEYDDDDDYGAYDLYETDPRPFLDEEAEPAIISIYEELDMIQLWHDATPYPSAANTEMEARRMMQTLAPSPVPVDSFTRADYENFIEVIRENYE